jgi:hypothetical protein
LRFKERRNDFANRLFVVHHEDMFSLQAAPVFFSALFPPLYEKAHIEKAAIAARLP